MGGVILLPKAYDFDFLIRGSKGRIGAALCKKVLAADSNFESNSVDYDRGSLKSIISTFKPATQVVVIASGNATNRSTKAECREDTLKLRHFLDYLAARDFFYVDTKLVFISSGGSVYGQSLEYKNEDSELNPATFYAEEKIIHETIILDWCRNFGVHPVILRLANVFDINFTSPKGLVESVISSSAKGSNLSIFGGRKSTKQYGEVRDYAYWILHSLAEIYHKGAANYEQSITINLFPNNIYSIEQIIDLVTKKFKVNKDIFIYNSDVKDIMDSVLLSTVHDFAFKLGEWKTLPNLIN